MGASPPLSASQAVVAGAAYTTFVDAADCLDSPNGVNCNNYATKSGVYASGGPSKAGLSNGTYYFAVLTPGSQNGGFVDGANGNLSDTTAGGTAGDTGGGDPVSNRTFTVSGHDIASYGGSHATGISPTGHFVIQLLPYDDTDNPGGVYILAICQMGATNPSQCKYDAFRLHAGTPCDDGGAPTPPVVAGGKYYDTNANGQWDVGEPGIAGWPISYQSTGTTTFFTDVNGLFSFTVSPDTYTFFESLPTAPTITFQNGTTTTVWQQTGNLVSQLSVSGPATAVLEIDKTYQLTIDNGSQVGGVYFGNLCLGKGGGLTLGFWSNKNGMALESTADLTFLNGLPLVNGTGAHVLFDKPATLSKWLLSANATNMAYMLSAQLAAMELNVRHNFVNAGALLYAPGTPSANANGYTAVQALMADAIASLAAHPFTGASGTDRSTQEAIKNALDNGNNNKNFVQSSPAACPAPIF